MKSLSPIFRNLAVIAMISLPIWAGKPEGAAVERAFAGVLAKYGVSGGALAVARDGQLVVSRGFGGASSESVFPIASCTKPITVAAAMVLVGEGRLRLDEPAWAIVPELVPWRRDGRLDLITVRDLMEHSGGWERRAGDIVVGAMRPGRLTGDILREIAGQPLDFAPGSRRVYSNVGALLLGAIVEKISGQAYETFVRERVLEGASLSVEPAVRRWGGAAGLTASMPDLVRFVDSVGEAGRAQSGDAAESDEEVQAAGVQPEEASTDGLQEAANSAVERIHTNLIGLEAIPCLAPFPAPGLRLRICCDGRFRSMGIALRSRPLFSEREWFCWTWRCVWTAGCGF